MKYIIFILSAILYLSPINSGYAQTQAVPFGRGIFGFKHILPFAAVGGGAYLGYKALHNTQAAGQDIDMAVDYAVSYWGGPSQSISLDQLRNAVLAHPLVGKRKASEALGKRYAINPTAVTQIAAMLGVQVKSTPPITIGTKVSEEMMILESRGWMMASVRKLLGVSSDQPLTNTQPQLQLHHIIGFKDPNALEARKILVQWKLSVHDPANGVIIPYDCHRGPFVHGQPNKQYEKSIVKRFTDTNQLLINSGMDTGRAKILQILREEGDKISSLCGDGRSIPLQLALRKAEEKLPRPLVNNYLDKSGVP